MKTKFGTYTVHIKATEVASVLKLPVIIANCDCILCDNSIDHLFFSRSSDLHCCKLASGTQCKEACQESLQKEFDSDAEAMDNLMSRGCGSPSLDVSLYNMNHQFFYRDKLRYFLSYQKLTSRYRYTYILSPS